VNCVSVESQTCTSETNNTLYAKKEKKKKIAGREKHFNYPFSENYKYFFL